MIDIKILYGTTKSIRKNFSLKKYKIEESELLILILTIFAFRMVIFIKSGPNPQFTARLLLSLN